MRPRHCPRRIVFRRTCYRSERVTPGAAVKCHHIMVSVAHSATTHVDSDLGYLSSFAEQSHDAAPHVGRSSGAAGRVLSLAVKIAEDRPILSSHRTGGGTRWRRMAAARPLICCHRRWARSMNTAHSSAVIQTLTPYVVSCSTVALMMVAPAMSAASLAAASPASQGVSRPIAP